MKNIMLYLFLGTTFAMMTTQSSLGNGTPTSLKFNSLQWTKNWDFKARNLPIASGNPSKIEMTLQPRIDRYDFFGFLGSFPSSQKDSFVGFAQTTVNIQNIDIQQKIILEVSSSTSHLVFRFLLKTPNQQNCSYQAEFKTTKKKQIVELYPKDFECVKRGALLPQSETIKFEDIDTIGFLITRSSQEKNISKSQTLEPFDLKIHQIKFL